MYVNVLLCAWCVYVCERVCIENRERNKSYNYETRERRVLKKFRKKQGDENKKWQEEKSVLSAVISAPETIAFASAAARTRWREALHERNSH